MINELQEELQRFYKDIINPNFIFERYLDEYDYKDEYSQNEIIEAQREFITKATEYLHNNAPNKFIIADDWGIVIMSVDRAKEKNILNYEDMIVR